MAATAGAGLRLGGQRLRQGQRLGALGCQLLLALGQLGALADALLALRLAAVRCCSMD
jgi:hypothetical protein